MNINFYKWPSFCHSCSRDITCVELIFICFQTRNRLHLYSALPLYCVHVSFSTGPFTHSGPVRGSASCSRTLLEEPGIEPDTFRLLEDCFPSWATAALRASSTTPCYDRDAFFLRLLMLSLDWVILPCSLIKSHLILIKFTVSCLCCDCILLHKVMKTT